MADRISTPVSSSPAHAAAIIARPTWPWQPSSSSSTSSLDYRQGSSSPRPTSRSFSSPIAAHTMWQPTSSRLSNTPAMCFATRNFQDDSTRQWSFLGFEWLVRGVHKLRDLVEGNIEIENPDFEILKESPMLGDNKFKLEIAFTNNRDGSSNNSIKPTLSLYITSLVVDFAQSDYELSVSMMAAIKCQEDRPGQRGAPPEWLWDFWQTNWIFRQGNEVWECPLPPLSTLLENQRIAETDSLVICVQIHCPTGLTFPQQPSVHSVPRDLLFALEASLDNANTGDIRFICLERQRTERSLSPPPESTTPTNFRPLSQTSSYSPFPARITARKRIMYAHSDILTRRSEYFANMLASSFSENTTPAVGDRKIYTIVVEEADFETIYWLLKFCYANWLLFREDDDPRIAMEGFGAGWSSRWPSLRGGEWDWKTFQKDDNDARSVGSGDSRLSASESKGSTSRTATVHTSNSSSQGSRSIPQNSKPITPPNNSHSQSNPASRRTTAPLSTTSLTLNNSSSLPRPKSVTVPVPTTTYVSPSRQIYPLSPHASRHVSSTSVPDPHPHPTSPPRPASALSMYQLAHRYAMPGLINLALEHMMSTLSPQTCFALLLATSVWDELHSLVEDFVVEKWDEVSVSEEFEQCCQEVAAGEWGADGGRTLTSIFRRLRAPQ